MDRGDTGFIIHESFKDLKARRAEQEAYRKALEEQIMQKRKLQEQERETHEGRKTHTETLSFPTPVRTPKLASHCFQPPEACGTSILGPPQNTPSHGRPTSKGRHLSFDEIDNYDEPHPAAAAATNSEEKSTHGSTPAFGIPEFSPECMKYLQQVMPGFTLPPLPATPADNNDSKTGKQKHTATVDDAVHQTSIKNGFYDDTQSTNVSDHNQAFSSGTTSESSSVEDVQSHTKANKIHVSQTSEQLEGVKVSRKQYREELQKQIDERKRREEESRRKAEEEEERIQEKIRIQQEKMQREYEEELRKQEEREKEAEKKRLAALAKQKETLVAREESKAKQGCSKEKSNVKPPEKSSKGEILHPSTSEESIQSIGEFFDETMIAQGMKHIDPDDRIIPVVAKNLREKSFHNNEKWPEEEQEQNNRSGKVWLTARIDSAFPDPAVSEHQGPPPPQPGLTREMAIRSAPCPPTTNSTDLEFLSTLRSYLENEKNKMDERMHAKTSKSTEKF